MGAGQLTRQVLLFNYELYWLGWPVGSTRSSCRDEREKRRKGWGPMHQLWRVLHAADGAGREITTTLPARVAAGGTKPRARAERPDTRDLSEPLWTCDHGAPCLLFPSDRCRDTARPFWPTTSPRTGVNPGLPLRLKKTSLFLTLTSQLRLHYF